jgi:hypothetical protein
MLSSNKHSSLLRTRVLRPENVWPLLYVLAVMAAVAVSAVMAAVAVSAVMAVVAVSAVANIRRQVLNSRSWFSYRRVASKKIQKKKKKKNRHVRR